MVSKKEFISQELNRLLKYYELYIPETRKVVAKA